MALTSISQINRRRGNLPNSLLMTMSRSWMSAEWTTTANSSYGVHYAACGPSPGIITTTPFFRRLHALAVYDSRAGRSLSSIGFSYPLAQGLMDPLPGSVLSPSAEVVKRRAPRGKVVSPPRAPASKYVHDGVHHLPARILDRTASKRATEVLGCHFTENMLVCSWGWFTSSPTPVYRYNVTTDTLLVGKTSRWSAERFRNESILGDGSRHLLFMSPILKLIRMSRRRPLVSFARFSKEKSHAHGSRKASPSESVAEGRVFKISSMVSFASPVW